MQDVAAVPAATDVNVEQDLRSPLVFDFRRPLASDSPPGIVSTPTANGATNTRSGNSRGASDQANKIQQAHNKAYTPTAVAMAAQAAWRRGKSSAVTATAAATAVAAPHPAGPSYAASRNKPSGAAVPQRRLSGAGGGAGGGARAAGPRKSPRVELDKAPVGAAAVGSGKPRKSLGAGGKAGAVAVASAKPKTPAEVSQQVLAPLIPLLTRTAKS